MGQLIIIIAIIVIFLVYAKRTNKKRSELEKNYVKNVTDIVKKQLEQLEKIRINTNKREEDRSRQWFESEKETLKVLDGVSKLLDLNEKIAKLESSKMIIKLEEMHNIIKQLIEKSDDETKDKKTNRN